MKIRDLVLKNPVIAAPMAGVSDKAFRFLAKEFNCSLAFTEMVSDKAIIYNNKKTYDLFDLQGEKSPIGVQIFGSEPDIMREAAKIVQDKGASIIDINMGCPTPKIVKNNEGSALMLQPQLAENIMKSVKEAVSVPVTVKMRTGWDEESINCIELAQRAQRAGISAVTVHGRTREQFYSGYSDWDMIREVVEAVDIPVIGNGDIWKGEDALKMLQHTGCSGVMIARGAMGNPWIFGEAVSCIAGDSKGSTPEPQQKIAMALRHLDLLLTYKPEEVAVKEMRKHIAWYVKGLKNASRVREYINQMETCKEVREKLEEYKSNFEISS